MRKLKVGTRTSPLAMKQVEIVLSQLPGVEVEVVGISTQGDRDQKSHLSEIGGKGIFVKEVEKQLLDGRIDFAVHSLKDMPAILPEGLTLAAYPKRANPLDCIVYEGENPLEIAQPRLGTSSVRREMQLRQVIAGVQIEPIRGKVETRLEKMRRQKLDGVVLACAGLDRMGYLADLTYQVLSPEQSIPAVAQGILGIECREDDAEVLELLSVLNDEATAQAALAEREFLALMNGNCDIPLGGLAVKNEKDWTFYAFLAREGEEAGRSVKLSGKEPKTLARQAYEQLK